jgi:hypothetical protein
MKIVELILDDTQLANGIEAISVVHDPAIESNFIALNSAHKIQFKTLDAEKRILMGPALIPNKPIYRHQEIDGEMMEFYVYFSKATIERASQMYLIKGNQNKATLEHEMSLSGLSLVESWIKEDMVNDKSAIYGLNDPVGTWMVSMKVMNDDIWENYVKTGKVRGFSIEGYFADKSKPIEQMAKQTPVVKSSTETMLDEVRAILAEYISKI